MTTRHLLFFATFFPGFLPAGELPVSPPNTAATVHAQATGFTLEYGGSSFLTASSSTPITVSNITSEGVRVEQRLRVTGKESIPVSLRLTLTASDQAIAAETSGNAQQAFPMIRTSHGPSKNRRNNAVYDRFGDWMMEMPSDGTRITPATSADGTTRFEITVTGESPEIIFRPRFYQKHRNIRHFEPWTYEVRKDSITGWCSWWAYQNDFNQEHTAELLDVWQRKRLGDYGYHYIQIDDCYQGALDGGRRNSPLNNGYRGGRPETWMQWKPERFRQGMTGYVDAVRRAGLVPGVWVGCFFSDEETAEQHPQWFVQGKDGKPVAGPYVSYAIDATVPEAANRLVRPTYRGFANAGFRYVKIDQLRHLLYDNLHHNAQSISARGLTPADVFRAYLRTAREELGDDTFLLSCWGVLPESVGLADACRIGGDGYGPVTMQQYNSWNGIVWRNDPDHCDIRPHRIPAEVGNVRKTTTATTSTNDTIIRPALASIAGCMLMLSDKAEVYEDDNNLKGIRRSSPVLFSVPGQLYDFDPRKTDILKTTERTVLTSGSGQSSIDGDQHGDVCPWWLNEFNLPFDDWNVLHRLNWSKDAATAQMIRFQDIGLDPEKEYIIFEFWTDRMLGIYRNHFEAPEIGAKGIHSFAIRETQQRPQLISTNRHLSQGAAELESLAWKNPHTLAGRSRVIAGDRYVLTLHVPDGHAISRAFFGDNAAEITREGNTARVAFLPATTGSVGWSIEFAQSGS